MDVLFEHDGDGATQARHTEIATVGASAVLFVAIAPAAGPLLGCAVAAGVAFGWLWLHRRVSRSATGPRTPVTPAQQFPAVLDLLAVCLAAGAAPERALAVVGAAFEGEVGELLSRVAKLAVLGAPVESAWATALSDGRWAPVARAVIRAHHSGAALTDVFARLADDRRGELRAHAHAAAQRAGIQAVLPLGVCFLPAFVLVGVVPVVAGFAQALQV